MTVIFFSFPPNPAVYLAFPPCGFARLECFSYLCSETSNPQPFMTNAPSSPRYPSPPCMGGVRQALLDAPTCARPFRNDHTPSGHHRHLSDPTSAPFRSNPCRLPRQAYTGHRLNLYRSPLQPIQVADSTLYRLRLQHYTGCGFNIIQVAASTLYRLTAQHYTGCGLNIIQVAAPTLYRLRHKPPHPADPSCPRRGRNLPTTTLSQNNSIL